MTFEGNKIGRKDKLKGQIGTMRIPLIEVWTIGPPALKLYAVLPVGVAIMSPSPVVVVNNSSFI